MGGRNVYRISILLLCLFSGACGNRKGGQESLSHENDAVGEEGAPFTEMIEEDRAEGIHSQEEFHTKDSIEEPNKEEIWMQGSKGVIEADALEAYSTQEELIEVLREYPAGTILHGKGIEESAISRMFYLEELTTEVKTRINGKSYGKDCELPYEMLRYIRVLHYDFEGNTRIGELIVNQAIAQDILDIFRELYGISYPIERMVLIDEYDAEDERSMAANNSSAFNYRFIAGTTRLSKHSLGWAIDINPLYNPYITTIDGRSTILPENASDYADRTKDCRYYIREGDACYEAFVSRGFTWGGDWKNSKDYQHFEKIVD